MRIDDEDREHVFVRHESALPATEPATDPSFPPSEPRPPGRRPRARIYDPIGRQNSFSERVGHHDSCHMPSAFEGADNLPASPAS
jgi:hypothetical protein